MMDNLDHNLTLRMATNELSDSEKDELDRLHQILEETLEREKEVKKEVADFCSRLLNRQVDIIKIRQIASIITQFAWYDFGDELDEVVRIAKKLERIEKASEEEIFGLLEEMKGLLIDYST